MNRPRWPSGLRRHEISQLIVATKGPRFESRSRHVFCYDEQLFSKIRHLARMNENLETSIFNRKVTQVNELTKDVTQ